MTVISVGQEELLARRTFFLENKKAQIIGRFMTHEHHFYGLRNLDDICTVLNCYDDPKVSEHPIDSGWSFTQFFFPEAYSRGERLDNQAATIYDLFVQIRQEYGLSSEFDIPMEYFSYTIENALKMYGINGDKKDWISVQQWREAIKFSGYVESEIYMAITE